MIHRGDTVIVRDAFGAELRRVAISGPKRGKNFPVIWVCRPEEWTQARAEGRDPEGVPWPRRDVWAAEANSPVV